MDIDYRLEEKVIEDLAAHLKRVMKERKISFTDEAKGIDVILEYLNATEKWIQPRPRQVFISSDLQAKIHSKQYYENENMEEAKKINRLIYYFKDLFIQGKNINNHLSSQIYTSKKQDMLFNSWNVKHIHLNDTEVQSKRAMKKNRSEWLLFCIVKQEKMFFLDVRSHPKKDEFSSYSLLKIIHDNHWMAEIGFEEMGDEYVPYSFQPQITDDKILYRIYNDFHGKIPFDFEGHGYMCLRGIVSTGDKADSSFYINKLMKCIRECSYTVDEYRGFVPIALTTGDGIVKFERDGKLISFDLKIDGINEHFRG